MVRRSVWWTLVLVAGLGGAVALALAFRFVPVVDDVVDPLGRPSALADSVVFSAGEFDRISGVLVPKHRELTERLDVLRTVADSLDRVVDTAGGLPPLAAAANDGTGHVVAVARPLPDLVGQITGRAKEATGAASDLRETVVDLTGGLQRVGDGLGTIHTTLQTLGPRGRDIAEVLARIEQESGRIAPLGPVLGAVSDLRNH